MSEWEELIGQDEAVRIFQAAAKAAANPDATAAETSMTHAWLITGPPGSGRSNLAYAFAASLLCKNGGCSTCVDCVQVSTRTHPDLQHLATEKVIITIDEVRELVQSSNYSPSQSRWRVIVIEDADRMAERTSNVLLKALEEPPPRTVWILCAPSEADMLPTIRSRVRTVRLHIPAVTEVAMLICERDGVDMSTAERAARWSQSHIGMARRLATNEDARARRTEALEKVLAMAGMKDVITTAARLIEIASEDANALTEERDAAELADLRRSMGLAEGDAVPPQLRVYVKNLEEAQKRRATRSLRDGIDRILIDLMSLYRDIVRVQLGVNEHLVNLELAAEITQASQRRGSEMTLATIDAIEAARERIDRNVAPALALEAMLVSALRRQAA